MAKKILDLFFKVEEDKPAKDQTITPQPAPVIPVSSPLSIVGQEDAQIKKQLADALEKANLEGYDYFEFAKGIEAQASIIPSEQLRFQSTFAVVGVTVEKLVSSAQHYLSVLKEKETEFVKAMDQHVSEAVVSKEQSTKDIDAEMQSLAEEIKKITDKINTLQQKKTSLMNEISQGKSEIDRVRNNFYATLKVFTDKISGDLEKIKTYLSK